MLFIEKLEDESLLVRYQEKRLTISSDVSATFTTAALAWINGYPAHVPSCSAGVVWAIAKIYGTSIT